MQMHEGNGKVGSYHELLGAINAGDVVSVHAAVEANQGLGRVPCGSM